MSFRIVRDKYLNHWRDTIQVFLLLFSPWEGGLVVVLVIPFCYLLLGASNGLDSIAVSLFVDDETSRLV